MEVTECALPSINPNNFPAKLWRLVNNPAYTAIRWDSYGVGILIDRHLFERQILSPCSIPPNSPDAFKTTNFSSFVRQLNLYGFRKVELSDQYNQLSPRGTVEIHHFFSPVFKRGHPELVGGLRRLTADNKAKMEAERSSLLTTPHQESAHPPYPKKAQPGTGHFGTPVPPRYLIRGHDAALSPSVFPSDKGIKLSFNQQYAGVASSSNAMHVQPGLLSHANCGKVEYQQGYFSPGCQCYQMKQTSQLPLSGLKPGVFPPYSYYQASHTVNMFYAGERNQELLNKENQELRKVGVNLDQVFQIADEAMQPLPSVCVVKVSTPEKPLPVFASTSHTRSPSITKESLPSVRPILTAMSGNDNQVKFEPSEISIVLVPEPLPEDAIPQQPSGPHTSVKAPPPLHKRPNESSE